MNKMIIVLDKICLLGVIGISFYAGYKTGAKVTGMKHAFSGIIDFANEVKKVNETESETETTNK